MALSLRLNRRLNIRKWYEPGTSNRLLAKTTKAGRKRRAALATRMKAHRASPMTVHNKIKRTPWRYSKEQVAANKAALFKKYGAHY